jgi:hypothetical protein
LEAGEVGGTAYDFFNCVRVYDEIYFVISGESGDRAYKVDSTPERGKFDPHGRYSFIHASDGIRKFLKGELTHHCTINNFSIINNGKAYYYCDWKEYTLLYNQRWLHDSSPIPRLRRESLIKLELTPVPMYQFLLLCNLDDVRA